MPEQHAPPPPLAVQRPRRRRGLWLAAGGLSLALGMAGIVLPLLPSVPFALLAAFCCSRGCERWLLAHPRFGPAITAWREHRAVPLRAKQAATVVMLVSSVGAWWVMPAPWRWVPGVCCAGVAVWLWRLPEAQVAGSAGG